MRSFTLNRSGVVEVQSSTTNQCKAEGWPRYSYTVRIFAGIKLDAQDFVIDHTVVHDTVTECIRNTGSCERMCLNVEATLYKKLRDHGVNVVKLYVRIQPITGAEANAFMEFEADYRNL